MNIETGLQIKRRGRMTNAEIVNEALKKIGTIDNPEKIAHWAYRLELANAMKAGVMDSESRHLEIAAQRQAIIAAVIAEMRA